MKALTFDSQHLDEKGRTFLCWNASQQIGLMLLEDAKALQKMQQELEQLKEENKQLKHGFIQDMMIEDDQELIDQVEFWAGRLIGNEQAWQIAGEIVEHLKALKTKEDD